MGKYAVTTNLNGKSVLLVDDYADSKWTLTIIGELLGQQGSGPVTPFVLATKFTGE